MFTVANVGKRDAAGFRIGMAAQRAGMTVRAEDYSLPLSLAKGATNTVEFRLRCNWITSGAVTAGADPNPAPGESPAKIANNVAMANFGATACS